MTEWAPHKWQQFCAALSGAEELESLHVMMSEACRKCAQNLVSSNFTMCAMCAVACTGPDYPLK